MIIIYKYEVSNENSVTNRQEEKDKGSTIYSKTNKHPIIYYNSLVHFFHDAYYNRSMNAVLGMHNYR